MKGKRDKRPPIAKNVSNILEIPFNVKCAHTNMAAVGFNYTCQMRDPVSFQISGGVVTSRKQNMTTKDGNAHEIFFAHFEAIKGQKQVPVVIVVVLNSLFLKNACNKDQVYRITQTFVYIQIYIVTSMLLCCIKYHANFRQTFFRYQ